MITLAQAAILGVLQGGTELFPVSSLGHIVLVPILLGWHIDQASDQFVAFVVLTHLATAVVLLGFFWSDWVRIISGMLRSLRTREISDADPYGKLGWLLVFGSIPAGILGVLFEQPLKTLFGAATIVSVALILNGLVLYLAEKFRRKAPEGATDDTRLAHLSWRSALVIGVAQCGALIPGFSRTGLTMTAGLVQGLSHGNAARFSFLLATPIIFAAALLKVPDLFVGNHTTLIPAFVGALCAGVVAYLSVRFLVRYFETKTLTPFAIYCVCAGVISLVGTFFGR